MSDLHPEDRVEMCEVYANMNFPRADAIALANSKEILQTPKASLLSEAVESTKLRWSI